VEPQLEAEGLGENDFSVVFRRVDAALPPRHLPPHKAFSRSSGAPLRRTPKATDARAVSDARGVPIGICDA